MAHKLGKKLLSWDESIDDEVRYRLDRQEEDLKEGVISRWFVCVRNICPNSTLIYFVGISSSTAFNPSEAISASK